VIGRTRKIRGARAVIGVLALTGCVGLAVMSTSASVSGATTALHKQTGVAKNWKNKLSSNTNGWCNNPVNAACDGSATGYGTIEIVKHSFTNFNSYAPAVPGPGGQSKYARLSGAESPPAAVETLHGCTVPGGENCTGPYTKFQNPWVMNHTVFPTGGYTTSIKIYLDASWAAANPGQVVNWDVGLTGITDTYLSDNSFALTSSGGGWLLGLGTDATAGPTLLSTSGWYTFNLTFTAVAGEVFATYSVLNSASTSVFASSQDTGSTQAATGGVRYGWFDNEDVLGLPVAQVSYSNL
jgi:hypothetical protein